jgi:hypothetical protein
MTLPPTNDSAETLVALPNDSTLVALTNDSTLTLVAPPASTRTLLLLSADSSLNTTFCVDGTPLYRLRTVGASSRTDLERDGAVVASLDRRLLGDVIQRPGADTVKVRKWAKFVGKQAAYVPRLISARPRAHACLLRASSGEHIAPPMTFTSGSEGYVWIVSLPGWMAVRGSFFPADTRLR